MRVPVLLVVMLVVTAGSGVAQTQAVVGQPSLTVSPIENQFAWGDQGPLTLSVVNTGTVVSGGPADLEERVTTARNVQLSIVRDRLDQSVERAISFSQERAVLGRLSAGDAVETQSTLSIGQSISPGVYEIPLLVSYEYTTIAQRSGETTTFNDREREILVRVPIRIADRPRIRIDAVEGQAVVAGTTEAYQITLTNTGTEPASELGVTFQTDNVTTQFGTITNAGDRTWLYVDSLDPGEQETRTITISSPPGTSTGTYLVAGSVQYRRPSGFETRTDSLRFGVQITASNTSQLGGCQPTGDARSSTAFDSPTG